MGLYAITRKGWKNNPKGQGRWNFAASIIGVIIGSVSIWIVDGYDSMCSVMVWIAPIFLAWGLISLFSGYALDKLRKKNNKSGT